MQIYTHTESNGRKVDFISLMPDPFPLAILRNSRSTSKIIKTEKEQTETKDPKPTPNEHQTSNFKEYHRRALLGTVPAL